VGRAGASQEQEAEGPRSVSAMMHLPTRSSLAELATLARRFRCYAVRSRSGTFMDVVELNESRARREAALYLGCSEAAIRVEPVATALNGLGLA